MTGRAAAIACVAVCLALAACQSGPSSSGPDLASYDERMVEFLGRLAVGRDEAARAWEAVVGALPDRLWPTEFVYDDGEIKVTGRALSNVLLADFISRLEESPDLTGVSLRSSVQKKARTGDFHEFMVAARSGGSAPPLSSGSTAQRLESLGDLLVARPGSADGLRELQRLAADSGLQMTKCVFGQASSGEFAGELPAAVEVAGSRAEIGRYLDGLARLPHFWLVKKLTVKAASPRDPRSSAKASIAVSAWFPN
jgi:hypothetical protein